MKKSLVSLLVAGALLTGCGHSTTPSEQSAQGPTARAAGEGNAPATSATLSSTCAPSVSGANAKIAFATALGCNTVDGCPADALTLDATTSINSASGPSTSTLTIHRGETAVVEKTVRVQGSTTTVEVAFGSDFQGLRKAIVTTDSTSITGSIDGRELAPIRIANGQAQGSLAFVDHSPVPDAQASAELQNKLWLLLDQASHDAPIVCVSPTGGALTGVAAQTLTTLNDAFWHAGSNQVAATVAAARTVEAANPVTPSTPVSSNLVSSVGSTTQALTNGTSAPQGAPPDFTDSSRQNNLLDFETPHCQSCTHSCAKRILDWFIPGATLECIGECFIPKTGDCAEDPCIAFGVSTCDDNQTCCGGSICCGGSTTCGSDSLGVCCPKNLPIACGDRTGQGCFAAGSSCCGNLNVACGPGQKCINVTATSASCCAASHVASDGACCDEPACGGQCCDGGSCVNGQCCFGPTNSNGQCCNGFGSTACGPNCCENNDVCTSGNTCCPQAQACGNSCCQSGQACINGACTGCAAGTVACNTSGGSATLCCAPGAECSATECCPSGQAYCSTRNDCRDPSSCPGIP